MPRLSQPRFIPWLISAVCLVLLSPVAMADDYLPIPKNIETYNVPPIPKATADRLARYNNARSAGAYGWQGDALMIGTRFAGTTQLHRVAKPLGYREQLTFIDEPIKGVYIPEGGAGEEIIVSWDVGGSEFNQLFLFNTRTGDSKLISDGKSLYGAALWSPDRQSFAYVTTARNGRNWDTHIQGLDGHINKVLETDSGYWLPIGWAPDGKKLLILNRTSVNVSRIYELDLASRRLAPLVGDDSTSTEFAQYDGRGGLYYISDQGSEFRKLHHLDMESGEVTVLTEDIDWDVSQFTLSPDRTKLAYSVNAGGTSELGLISTPRHRSLRIPELPQGIVSGLVFAPDGNALAMTLSTPKAPGDVYVADLKRRALTRWTRSEIGGLDAEQFVEADLIQYTSFDGLDVPAFVFKPETPGPHPVVIYIHGGPESQYRPFFSTLIQSIVNELNVAVIAPNVRGSRGYGKSYLKMDNGYKREDSVKDIGALLDWIDGRTEFRSDRVAVMGGSYGGYMVLASMVHYGDRLTAAVESVGISNFVTFLENTQPYRQDMRRVEYGDERDPDMRTHLEAISPLNHVDKMKTPVLVLQGANDPRVPASESEQIRVALEEQGVPVWYVLARDEGHGFRKKENRDFDRAARFGFLDAHLNRE